MYKCILRTDKNIKKYFLFLYVLFHLQFRKTDTFYIKWPQRRPGKFIVLINISETIIESFKARKK